MDPTTISQTVIEQLEAAWNAGDGAAFARAFAADADFVNIRGELHSGTEAIAAGHQGIFDTIYRGSTVRYTLIGARALDERVVLAQVSGALHVPAGPLAGDLDALASIVVVAEGDAHRVAAFHNTLVAG